MVYTPRVRLIDRQTATGETECFFEVWVLKPFIGCGLKAAVVPISKSSYAFHFASFWRPV